MGKTRQQRTIEDFDLLQAVVIDMNGTPRGKLLAKPVARHFFQKGTEVIRWLHTLGPACGLPKSVDEIMNSSFSNVTIIPARDTLVEIPWASKRGRRVGQVIAHSYLGDGQPDPSTVRYQVERQYKRLQHMGYRMTASFTYQFTVFKSDTDYKEFLGDTEGPFPYSAMGVEEIMLDLCEQLQGAGVDVESWSSRNGRGAFEISVLPREGLRVADMACRLKQGTKSVLAARGYLVTFMTHPPGVPDDVFSTFTFRYTFHTPDGQNVFYSETQDDQLSDVARHWIAGTIHHGAAMTSLCSPTVNCYSRLQHDNRAPKHLSWDLDSDSTLLSIHKSDKEIWIENRLPGSACNPYLVMLATLASGIDGIEKSMECPVRGSPDAGLVPGSLGDALEALNGDQVLQDALSPLLFQAFVSIKLNTEVKEYEKLEAEAEKEKKIEELEKQLYLWGV